MRRFWTKLRLKYAIKLWPFLGGHSKACANRVVSRYANDEVEATLVLRNLKAPDGYSREELIEMLQTVRAHELIQGWKVPEPNRMPEGISKRGSNV